MREFNVEIIIVGVESFVKILTVSKDVENHDIVDISLLVNESFSIGELDNDESFDEYNVFILKLSVTSVASFLVVNG